MSQPRGRTLSTHSAGSTDATADIITDSEYAKHCKEVMSLYRDLRELGTHHDFAMPKVVVIGGQSTGKSSLVEAVSGINVPRDAGTCTRCPMQCTMTTGEVWSCTISIEWAFDENHKPLPSHAVRLELFGPERIYDKSTMELWIRRAQAAVLSSHRPREHFRGMSIEEIKKDAATDDKRRLPFSRNVVDVRITDPEATELSFVDLPGLVENVGSKTLVNLVETTVKNYVRRRDTLILVVMPMVEDIERQGALALAKDVDPEGMRIIGVITKPDMVTEGALGAKENWKRIIVNEKGNHILKHGYYCVRLPDDAQRAEGLSRPSFHRISTSFFDTTHPWASMSDRSRFGIPNLVRNLSALLIEKIAENLPSLYIGVLAAIEKCLDRLTTLPPQPKFAHTPTVEIMVRMTAFCKEFEQVVAGEKRNEFVQCNRKRYDRFKVEISQTAPNFYPIRKGTVAPAIRSLGSSAAPRITLEHVRKVIASSIGWELPGHLPYEAIKVLVVQHIETWDALSQECLAFVTKRAQRILDSLSTDHFEQFPKLQSFVEGLVDQTTRQTIASAETALHKSAQLEKNPLFTLDTGALKSEETSWRNRYVSAAKLDRDSVDSLRKVVDAVVDQDFSDELTVMAKVQAYFQVACKRYVDYSRTCPNQYP